MKRLFALSIAFIVFFLSCDTPPNKQQSISGVSLYLEKVRGCEYVIWYGYKSGGLVHAADCRNPIHGNPEVVSLTSNAGDTVSTIYNSDGTLTWDSLIISHNNQ